MEHVHAAVELAKAYALQLQAAVLATTKEDVARYTFWTLAICGFLSLVSLALVYLWAFLTHWDQNLKKKYNATWALVTGASSGIGLSIARQLAAQGLNVVLVALPDSPKPRPGEPTLAGAVAGLRKDYPDVTFRTIEVVLGKEGYIQTIAQATADIPVTLVFNNAGYMVTGFFEDGTWERHEANIACNSTAAIALTHLFLTRMRAAGQKGCITFTSSPANMMPSPFSCLYGATKAMITHFATSLAPEVKPDGIDVAVIHPSPVATNFYTGAHNMPTLMFFKGTAGGPDHVARVLLRGIGRSVIIDQGYYPLSQKLPWRLIELTLLTEIMPHVATLIADYKVLKAAQLEKKALAAAGAAPPTPATTAAVQAGPASAAKSSRAGSTGPQGRRRKSVAN